MQATGINTSGILYFAPLKNSPPRKQTALWVFLEKDSGTLKEKFLCYESNRTADSLNTFHTVTLYSTFHTVTLYS